MRVSSPKSFGVGKINYRLSNNRGLRGPYAVPGLPTYLWAFEQAQTSPRQAVPNVMSNLPVSTNMFAAPRNLFTGGMWTGVSTTLVDRAVTMSDGVTVASTIVGGATNWRMHPTTTATLPAGTYTMGITVQRNTGTDQQFCLYIGNTGNRGSALTASSTMSRQSRTFTVGSGTSIGDIGIGSVDGSTAGNIQIVDFELYQGSADLGAEKYGGHAYLGVSGLDTTANCSGGKVDMSTGGFGIVPEPSTKTVGAFTIQCLVSKQSSGGNIYFPMVSNIASHTTFSPCTEINTFPSGYINSSTANVLAGPNGVQSPGLFVASGKGYHCVSVRYDGTNYLDYIIDGVIVARNTVSITSFNIADLFINCLNLNTNYGGNSFAGVMAFYNGVCLTMPQLNNLEVLNRNIAAKNSITATKANRYLFVEGDSITNSQTYSYPYLYGPDASPALYGMVYAVTGSHLTDLYTRAPWIIAAMPENRTGIKMILHVLIGTNDYTLPTGSYITSLAAYCDMMRAAGFYVIIGTILPCTLSGFNVWRNTINNAIYGWVGTHVDAISDFAGNSLIGPDSVNPDGGGTSPTTYYIDGKHPNAAGSAVIESICKVTINAA